MSVTCETIGSDDEFSQALSNSKNNDQDSFEEELDYEEEMDEAKSNKNEDDGELSDTDDNTVKDNLSKTKGLEKDEGELDEDEELEEGEVKEEEEEEEENEVSESNDNERSKASTQDNRNSSRHDMQKHGKSYTNNSYWPNQNFNNSRYVNHNRNERYTNNRTRDYNPVNQTASSESAWERGLKQARELLSKASKRKEEEVDFDNKRLNLTVDNINVFDQTKTPNRDTRDRSPIKRRRHSSQHSSSEDEVERRHRLAYDAAPWNNQSSSNYGNYRNKSNYSSNRSAETYRDPWRRSKSPKLALTRNKKPEIETRLGEIYKREKLNSDSRRSNSMSSLSSIDSDSSNFSGSEKSNGRKLPYPRPNLENKNRYERENVTELPYRNDCPKSRMDRIPKKSNASHYQSKDQISETKSFDSWSESLSDSDSSSFFSNSDSESDESDADISTRNKSSKTSKKLSEKRSQSKLKKHAVKTIENTSHFKQFNKDSNIESRGSSFLNNKSSSRSNLEKEAHKKAPIKMTFLKTQTSLKKDKLIDEQLNGETFELEDMDTNISISSKISSGKSATSKSHSEDEETKNPRSHKDSSSSSTSSNKLHRREELLLKLKAVEEAIERKLNSKKE